MSTGPLRDVLPRVRAKEVLCSPKNLVEMVQWDIDQAKFQKFIALYHLGCDMFDMEDLNDWVFARKTVPKHAGKMTERKVWGFLSPKPQGGRRTQKGWSLFEPKPVG